MKIRDIFDDEQITLDFIEEKFEGPYWEKVHSFVEENWQRDMKFMTKAQIDWLSKIVDDCVEKRLEE